MQLPSRFYELQFLMFCFYTFWWHQDCTNVYFCLRAISFTCRGYHKVAAFWGSNTLRSSPGLSQLRVVWRDFLPFWPQRSFVVVLLASAESAALPHRHDASILLFTGILVYQQREAEARKEWIAACWILNGKAPLPQASPYCFSAYPKLKMNGLSLQSTRWSLWVWTMQGRLQFSTSCKYS